MQESEEAKAESSEIAQEQDKNQTSISRMQSDSRSETGNIKLTAWLVCSKHYIVFRDHENNITESGRSRIRHVGV